MVLVIEGSWGNMMAMVPSGIGQLTIVSVVRDHLLFGYFEAGRVTHAGGELEHTLGVLSSERRITIYSRNGRPHLSEDSNASRHN